MAPVELVPKVVVLLHENGVELCSRSQSSWKASTRLPGPHAERAWPFGLCKDSQFGEEHRRAVSEHCSEVVEGENTVFDQTNGKLTKKQWF